MDKFPQVWKIQSRVRLRVWSPIAEMHSSLASLRPKCELYIIDSLNKPGPGWGGRARSRPRLTLFYQCEGMWGLWCTRLAGFVAHPVPVPESQVRPPEILRLSVRENDAPHTRPSRASTPTRVALGTTRSFLFHTFSARKPTCSPFPGPLTRTSAC